MVYWNNKLGKYRAMRNEKELDRHLPPTSLATKTNVSGMLERYRVVYLKPSHGTGGFGILMLSRINNGYRLQNGTRSQIFTAFEGAYAAFERAKGLKTYLVQKGIPLLRHHGCPFDIRIMVQQNPQYKWEVTGIVGRVAQKHKVVTNYHNGGKPMPIKELLAPFIPKSEMINYLDRLNMLSIRISSHLSGIFPHFRAYGVDIGIDKDLQPWIIEVNTRPDKSIFNSLKDKQMFRKIILYERLVQKQK